MYEYFTAVLALLASCVGVFGETRNRYGRGWRRLTWLGYTSLVLAMAASAIALFKPGQSIWRRLA